MAALVESNESNLEKIESFINDTSYREIIESAVNYNTRLCIERRLRLPFLDSQTGVAQNHSNLYMHRRQRMPGIAPGQIYTYPRPRWRKRRRQYLSMGSRVFPRIADSLLDGDMIDVHNISQVENPALMQDNDSKDSQLLKDDVPKEWYYDEQDMLEMDTYDEPDQDSDLDYEETYSKRNKRRKSGGRNRGGNDSPNVAGRRKSGGRGRKKAVHNFEPTPGDPDKPFACELCGARYKTRPGLTYHYGHSHKEGASDENSRDSNAAVPLAPHSGLMPGAPSVPSGCVAPPSTAAPPQPGAPPHLPPVAGGDSGAVAAASRGAVHGIVPGSVYQDSYVSFLNQPIAGTPRSRGRQPPMSLQQQQQSATSQSLASQAPPNLPPSLQPSHHPPPPSLDDPPMPILVPEKNFDLPPHHPHHPPMPPMGMVGPPMSHQPSLQQQPPSQHQPMPPHQMPHTSAMLDGKPKDAAGNALPSPYCDFCLGDARENKKTGGSEELVSCSDCGRSGHPTCLQFTDNMIISVRKYRWQCIECKCCSMCGTSDNDDQLLFCDDCDRGYHMYCLTPPLNTPPEGSWSCKLCIDEFHHRK